MSGIRDTLIEICEEIIEYEGSKPKNIFKFILVELKKTK